MNYPIKIYVFVYLVNFEKLFIYFFMLRNYEFGHINPILGNREMKVFHHLSHLTEKR